ncbi:glycoside hydrolase family 13 protein [Schizothecium vesticola]|uniref:Glycoside hydrolase family 13 protein n=1 Tax=Schizothecium vesticola TaxID=314040 RepID=A0AA40KAR6_9PEZI|nr:glycoside hydrolase family 13 protein [Schizothecium vesticola]
MAFGHDPYRHIAYQQFHLRPPTEPDNPDSYQSDANRVIRDGFGGEPWRYIQSTPTYHPETGEGHVPVHPSWAFHRAHLARWMNDFAAVNYITSHDIEGWRKERLFNFLASSGVRDVARRARLAFALLLTSVGTPMIFAGEEFCDQMDSSVDMRQKQTDPVNYERKDDGGWRQALFGYVANLVRFRTRCPALGDDETDFFHVDRGRGGRIMAWRRGGGEFPVVVVVNLSDEDMPGAEYVVPNWPGREKAGWREVSQKRDVPAEWVGREPLLRWEAKIYTRWRE